MFKFDNDSPHKYPLKVFTWHQIDIRNCSITHTPIGESFLLNFSIIFVIFQSLPDSVGLYCATILICNIP